MAHLPMTVQRWGFLSLYSLHISGHKCQRAVRGLSQDRGNRWGSSSSPPRTSEDGGLLIFEVTCSVAELLRCTWLQPLCPQRRKATCHSTSARLGAHRRNKNSTRCEAPCVTRVHTPLCNLHSPDPRWAGCSCETCGHVQREQPAHCRMEARGRQVEALVSIMRRERNPGALSKSLASLLPLNRLYVSVYAMLA